MLYRQFHTRYGLRFMRLAQLILIDSLLRILEAIQERQFLLLIVIAERRIVELGHPGAHCLLLWVLLVHHLHVILAVIKR